MANCENCGATFEPSNEPKEVTSLRVLCANCEAERRERKKQAAAQKAVPVPTSTPAARPKASAAPASPASPKSADSPKPRLSETAARAKPAAPAPAPKIAAKPKVEAAAEAAPERASAKRRRADAGEEQPKSGRSMDVMREKELLKKKQERTIMIGWMVAGGAVLIALMFYLYAKNKNDQKVKEEQDRIAAETALAEKVKGFALDTEENCKLIISTTDEPENHKIWFGSPQAADIQSKRSKAVQTLQMLQEKRELKGTLDELLKKLESPTLTIDELASIRRDFGTKVETKKTALEIDDQARYATALQTAERKYIALLFDDARKAAQLAKDDESKKAALGKFTKTEDELTALYDIAASKHIKEAEDYWKEQYQTVIKESDELAVALFTEKYVAAQPWKDLLVGEIGKNWNASKGFGAKLEKGALYLKGPDAAAGADGVISVGDLDKWRDFVVEYDFTIVKGAFDIYYRLGKRVDGTVESNRFSTLPNDPSKPTFTDLSAGESYTATLTFIGSNWVLELQGQDPVKSEVRWAKSRKGAIGIVVGSDSEIKLTKMRIKALRQSG